jgi:probable F420-dependent oxidoreductase
MEFWQFLAFTEVEQLTEIARIAEEVGFTGVLLGDHILVPEKLDSPYPYTPDGKPGFDSADVWPDPWVSISAMAAVTSKLRFGTSVYILPLRSPFQVAKSIGTAAVISRNRVALGTGAGWMREEYAHMNMPFKDRGKRYDEMIEILRLLWRGGMTEYHGQHFDFDRLEISPAPTESIPIWIGGHSNAALRRAARIGDGWIGTGCAPEEIPKILGSLHELRSNAGREDMRFETRVSLTAMPDRDLYRRVEDQGLTGVVHWPFKYLLGPSSSIEQKRTAMERYAEDIIVPLTRGH